MSHIERAEEAHGQAGTTLAESAGGDLDHFDNPGLPEHRHRMGDTDPKAAKRAERQVAVLLVLSMVGTIGVIVSIIAIKYDGSFERISSS
ncbi:MAG: hypothetical protein ACRYF3_10765, partial [Janthinobacterium lividum]